MKIPKKHKADMIVKDFFESSIPNSLVEIEAIWIPLT